MTLTARLISGIGFMPASEDEVRSGLLGYVVVTFAGLLVLDGLVLRVTTDGRHTLSYPKRTDRYGIPHSLYKPVDDRARRIIERAVFAALGIEEEPR